VNSKEAGNVGSTGERQGSRDSSSFIWAISEEEIISTANQKCIQTGKVWGFPFMICGEERTTI